MKKKSKEAHNFLLTGVDQNFFQRSFHTSYQRPTQLFEFFSDNIKLVYNKPYKATIEYNF